MNAMPAPAAVPFKVLVLDDDAATRAVVAYQLDRLGHQVIEAGDALWALELFERHRPDLIFSDVDMPQYGGYWFAREVRRREQGSWTPIIFLSALTDVTNVAEGIESGGDDYLAKPVHSVVLEAKIQAMRRLRAMHAKLTELSRDLQLVNEELQRQTLQDGLTGLLNRRGLDAALGAAIKQGRRTGQPLTLILCDVDFFKRYNDALGHHAGDECLRRVSSMLSQLSRRPMDAVARYGGEEFALILPDTPKSGALTLARAISRVFESAALPHPDSPVGKSITMSGGITTCLPDASTTAAELLMRADEALYIAKSKGRNRFFSFEMQIDSEA